MRKLLRESSDSKLTLLEEYISLAFVEKVSERKLLSQHRKGQ